MNPRRTQVNATINLTEKLKAFVPVQIGQTRGEYQTAAFCGKARVLLCFEVIKGMLGLQSVHDGRKLYANKD